MLLKAGTRRALLVCVAWLCALALLLALAGALAQAAVTHKFQPELSAKLSEGVPLGCGAAAPESPCIPGPFGAVSSLTVDSGHVWAAERIILVGEFVKSRVDRFDASTGEFLPPQLDEEAGVFELAHGVAVGHPEAEEEVYVGAAQEGTGNVVTVFGPSGKLQATWNGANTPSGAFAPIRGVAVDGSTNPETHGDVYVATANVVDVFKAKAGGEEPPTEEVTQLTGTPSGPFAEPTGVGVSPVNGDVLVADGERVIDVFEPSALGYVFLRPIEGAPQGAFKSIGPMAIDSVSGNVYVVEKALNVVDEFGPEGKYLGRLTGTPSGPFKSVRSVAVDPVTHGVFAGDYSEETRRGSIDAFGEELIVPDAETLPATEVAPESAQLNGTINPRGAGAASCQFVWGESEALGNVATCPTVENGEAAVPRSAALKGLTPDTKYFYRLQAGNENGLNAGEEAQAECEGKPSVDACFTTLGPGLHGQWASEVSSTAATLNAKVNPHGKATEVFFEYGPSTSYGKNAPAAPVAIGSGEEDVPVEAHLQALTAGMVYHFRAVAANGLGEFRGPDRMFMTQGAFGGFVLPDGRQWEMVSPPDKHGSQLLPIGEAGVVQSSAPGAALTYLGTRPIGEHPPGYYDFTGVQVVSARGASGWSSQDIGLPHAAATGFGTGLGREYRFFSNDFSRALVEPQGEFTSLKPEVSPPDSERTPYVRKESSCEAKAPTACFEPLVTGAPGYENVPPGTKFGGSGAFVGGANFVGSTPDLAHVILKSTVDLTSTPTGGREELYEWSAGRPPGEQLRLLSILPENAEPAAGAHLGSGGNDAMHAVSDDGSRIVWLEVVKNAKSEPENHLYMRMNATQPPSPLGSKGECTVPAEACTIQLDAVQPGASGAQPVSPAFQAASSDGSKVFFTDTQRLTSNSGALNGKPDLYECEVVELQCRLSDLTPSSSGEAADVRGTVLGASEDGTWIYFAANGVLGEGAKQGAVPGNCNGTGSVGVCTLYVWHGGETLPVAVLSGEDHNDWSEAGGGLQALTARVAPAGGWLAFMSSRSLTGYDNIDAHSPPNEPHHDEEVFLYHPRAAAGGKLEPGRLLCASCNPTGARPAGAEYGVEAHHFLYGGDRVWSQTTWIAANVPGWTPYQVVTALHQSRYLSDEGRLFFNSSDALVPQDVNNNEDVYEYEPAGVGGCSTSSSTYSERSGGCVALISSGRAAGESAFLDASENGNDVFFLTGERLVSQDVDTALDVYDAHVCSAAEPCFSSSTSPPPCATADACRSAPAPQSQVFGPGPSETFTGAGNLAPPAPRPATTLTRAQKLAKAIGACRKRYKKASRRRACERQAHRRYGAKPSRKATKGERR